MKKYLTLVVIALLAIAPFANASFSLSNLPSSSILPGTYTIAVSASDAANYDFGVGLDSASYSAGIVNLVNPVKGPATGDLFGTQDYRESAAAWFISSANSGNTVGVVNTAGIRAYIDLVVNGNVGDAFTVMLYNPDLSVAETANFTITQIPEPMTMGLLGLGGLFLARKKK